MATPFVTDGQIEFSGGVNSDKVPTIVSPNNPNGLGRNQTAWMANATCRGGSISPRASWLKRLTMFDPNTLKLTISGAGIADANGDYIVSPSSHYESGIFYIEWYKQDNSAILGYNSSQGWQLSTNLGAGVVYQSNSTVRNPQYITDWTLVGIGSDPKPTIVTNQVVIEKPLYQGAKFYEPDSGSPYILALVSGHVILVDPSGVNPPRDLSGEFNLYHPQTTTKAFFEQAENYMVIQAGDYDPIAKTGTLPLIWDGAKLVRSNGITGVTTVGAATPDVYKQNTVSVWTVPVVTGTVTIQLDSPYQGNLYDVITIAVHPSAPGPHAGNTIGAFRVTTKVGNSITVTCQSLTGTVPAGTAMDIADTPLTFTLTISSSSGTSINILPQGQYTCSAATGPVSATVAQTLTLNAQPITINTGDQLYLWNTTTSKTLGVFTVANSSAGSGLTSRVTLTPQYVLNTGTSFIGSLVFLTFNGVSGIPFAAANAQMFIPPIGQQIKVSAVYYGSVGDLVTIPNCGAFRVASIDNTTSGFGGIQTLALVATSPLNVGTVFPWGVTADQLNSTAAPTNPWTFTPTITQAPSVIGTLINQIPAAKMMRYYQNRLWYAQGRTVSAGDIVGDTNSGTAKNNYRDAVICVTENPLIIGGDGFSVPSNAGDITGLEYAVNINQPLGQGPLYVGTKKQIYSLTVPVSRNDWISATANNQPLFVPVQKSSGWASDRCIVSVNEDLFYFDPKNQIRSLIQATRYFGQWGNTPISSNERRITSLIDSTLLPYVSGVYFDNRLLVTCLPKQVTQGVVCSAIVPLDFDVISTFETKLPPAWEGHYEGLNIFQLVYDEDNDEVYAFTLGGDGSIQLWQIMADEQYTTTDPRFQYRIEFPAYTCQSEFDLKKMIGGEFNFDQMRGEVDFLVEYRPDGATCWEKWFAWKECFDTQTDTYPSVEAAPGYSKPRTLPKPPEACNPVAGRPAYIAHQHQIRLTVTGHARLRGLLIYFEPVVRSLYANLN